MFIVVDHLQSLLSNAVIWHTLPVPLSYHATQYTIYAYRSSF